MIASVAASSTALIQQVLISEHVNTHSKNVLTALFTQERIDDVISDRINVLQEAILYMGTQIQNIEVRLTTAYISEFVLFPCSMWLRLYLGLSSESYYRCI